MVARLSAAAKRKAATEQRAKEKEQRAAVASTCLQRLDVADSKPQAKRIRTRTNEEALNKSLRDNFPGWGEYQFDMVYRDGATLRQTLQLAKEKGKATGKFFYQELRAKFNADNSPETALQVADKGEPEDTKLNVALVAAFRHNKNMAPLSEWMESVRSVNQKVLVAVYKAMLRLPSSSFENVTVILGALRLTKRLALHAKFESTYGPMVPYFDQALCKSVSHCRANEQSIATWWSCFGTFADLILPKADMDMVVSCTSEFADVEQHIKKVVTGSLTGKKLFSRAWDVIVEGRADKILEHCLKSLDGKSVSPEGLVEQKRLFCLEMEKVGRDPEESFGAREVRVVYRGTCVPVVVNSYMDFYSTRVQALIRGWAVDCGSLPPLWCENDLVDQKTVSKVKVPASVLDSSLNARRSCHEFLQHSDSLSGLLIKDTLTKKMKFLRSIDRFFKVEAAFFFASIGSSAESRLQQAVLRCLPTVEKKCTPVEALGSLEALSRGRLLEFCGASLQSSFNCVRDMVQCIADKRAPRFLGDSGNAWLGQVKVALSLFCEHFVGGGGDSAKGLARRVYGKAALDARFAEVQEVASKPKATMDYAMLEMFHTFKWLLSGEQAKEVECWTEGLMVPIYDGKAEKEPKKGRKPRNNCADAKALVASLYT